VNGYVVAMRPTVLVAAAALGLAAVSCLAVVGRRKVEAERVLEAA
jgi:hypothetical protein